MEAVPYFNLMKTVTIWKLADVLAKALIVLVSGLLFSWWIGVTVFLLTVILVFGRNRMVSKRFLESQVSNEQEIVEVSHEKEDEWYYYYYRLHHGDKD